MSLWYSGALALVGVDNLGLNVESPVTRFSGYYRQTVDIQQLSPTVLGARCYGSFGPFAVPGGFPINAQWSSPSRLMPLTFGLFESQQSATPILFFSGTTASGFGALLDERFDLTQVIATLTIQTLPTDTNWSTGQVVGTCLGGGKVIAGSNVTLSGGLITGYSA